MIRGYDTNLAAEFHVLSVLHRLGIDATLTLGNKKSVDIAIVRNAGDALTVDVKGLAGMTAWPVDNFRERPKHFLVLVCFLNKIDDPNTLPEVYIVPSDEVARLTYYAPGGSRRVVQLSKMRKEGAEFRGAWDLLR